MKNRVKTLILTLMIDLIPIVVGTILYDKLPDQMVTHWNFEGVADGWSSKAFTVYVLPLIFVAVNIVCYFSIFLDPKRKNIGDKLFDLCLWIIPVLSIFTFAQTIGTGLGYEINPSKIMPVFICLLFIIIGNYLPKTKQSYTMGIKIPWTLESEENWNKTHRMAGFLWVVCGIIGLVCSLFGFLNPVVFLTLIFVMVLVPVIYSYLLYRKGI